MRHAIGILFSAAFLCGLAAHAVAETQVRVVERAAKGSAGRDIRVGVYVNVLPDCSSGPLPSIRLSAEPQNGKVVVKRAKVSATNYKKCLALQVPAFVALYRSKPDFGGTDHMTIEVKYPNGRTEIQNIKVQVGAAKQERAI